MHMPEEMTSKTGGRQGVHDTVAMVLRYACSSSGGGKCNGNCGACALSSPTNFMAHLKEVKESGDG